MKKLALSLSLIGMIGAAHAFTLTLNGDFEAGGADWGYAGVGADLSIPGVGGNPDGHARIDQTAGGWGGVLFTAAPAEIPISVVGVTAGATETFALDMINLGSGTATAGMKIEFWTGGGLISDTGDITFLTSGSWDTYTFDFLVPATTTEIKFVPLMVAQPIGSAVGFDNVGVIPEPSSSILASLGAAALLLRRRR